MSSFSLFKLVLTSWRIPLLFGGLLMSLVATLYGVSSTILLDGFRQLEQETARQKTRQVLDTIDRDLETLSSTVRDYARWDDSYIFVQDGNPDYIAANLQANTYETLGLGLIAFIRKDGTLTFAHTYDPQTGRIAEASQAVRSHLTLSAPLLQLPDIDSDQHGILRVGNEVWLVASRAITDNDNTAPIPGYVLMGQRLDAVKLKELEELTNVDIKIQPLRPQQPITLEGYGALDQTLKTPTDIAVYPDQASISAYVFQTDVYHQSAVLFQVIDERSIYQQGLLSLRYLGWSLLSIGTVSTILVSLLLRQSMQYLRDRDRMEAELQREAALRQSQMQYREKAQALEKALQELHAVQAHLLQTEKMSSLGQLTAGLAHELNNPLSFIYGNLAYAQDYSDRLLELLDLYQQHYPQPPANIQEKLDGVDLSFIAEDLPSLFKSMERGTQRIHHVVRSLQTFSRNDQAGLKWVNLIDSLESTLDVLQGRLSHNQTGQAIAILRDYEKLPLVECDPGQLNQVFFNLLSNAIEALEEGVFDITPSLQHPVPSLGATYPYIRITTRILEELSQPAWIAIHIANNGPPIPEPIQQRLFDPFFTTKAVGKGTGLGLAICYQNIRNHRGYLTCTSFLNQEVEFTIRIPTQSSAIQPSPIQSGPIQSSVS